MLLSLFSGPGGMDLGFERAGFTVGLAFDRNPSSVNTYNLNRPATPVARCADIRDLTVETLDSYFGGVFQPTGVIGGPPCQSFSQANRATIEDDPRHELPIVYAKLLHQLTNRSPVHFFVMENVPGLCKPPHVERFAQMQTAFSAAGFVVFNALLNASEYQTPQSRERLFVVGLNRETLADARWVAPSPTTKDRAQVTVHAAIAGLPEPVRFCRDADPSSFPVHQNHWCMRPRSSKFERAGALVPGRAANRSFKTLAWDEPSYTVAYGNREVHIHPEAHRRLSVYEAMLLQGFPPEYVLSGNLSSQINQVSEAVPPPLAESVALSIRSILEAHGH